MTREEQLQFESLIEALEPFADLAKAFCCDDRPMSQSVSVVVSAGDLQNAWAALDRLEAYEVVV